MSDTHFKNPSQKEQETIFDASKNNDEIVQNSNPQTNIIKIVENNESVNKSLDISRLSEENWQNQSENNEDRADLDSKFKESVQFNWDDQNSRTVEQGILSNQSNDEEYDMNERDLDENFNPINIEK